jgi:hypothetical protein
MLKTISPLDIANSLRSNATTGEIEIVGPSAGTVRVLTVPDVDTTLLAVSTGIKTLGARVSLSASTWTTAFAVPFDTTWLVTVWPSRNDANLSGIATFFVSRGVLNSGTNPLPVGTTVVATGSPGVDLRVDGENVEIQRTYAGGGARQVAWVAVQMNYLLT